MGSVNQIKIIVEAVDEATEPIEQVTEATKKLGRQSKKTTTQSKKDWGGLGDLFGQVLPRNLQSLTRGFKGTQRQVGRLSKGFKVLKSAWASIGIGVIILALEELIDGWDRYSEILGFTTQQQKREVKAQEQVTNAQIAATAELDRYIQTAQDANATERDRVAALEELTKSFPQLAGLELGSLETNQAINQAMSDHLAMIKLQSDETVKQEALEDRILKAQEEGATLTGEELVGYNQLLKAGQFDLAAKMKANILAERQADIELQFADDKKEAIQSQRDTDKEINKIQESITLQIKEQKDLAEDKAKAEKDALQLQREAEAARKKAIAEAEADARWLADQRIQIAQETELRLIQDEEQRELRSLEIQHEAAKAELTLRGGTLEDKLALEKKYTLDKEAIEKDYKERADEQAALDDQKAKDDAATLTEALATDQENEIQRARDKYAALQELAVADSQESLDLTQMLGEEEAAIIEKFEKQKRDEDIKTQNLKIQGMIKLANATRGILGNLSDMAEGNAEQQRNLAIVDVLLSQAIAVGNAIAGATAAGLGTGIAAPLTTPIFIAQMVGSVLASFAGIKGILNKAGASMPTSGGGGSGGGGFVSDVQVPLPARLDTPDSMQAYVVQSQLQGQMNAQGRLDSQIIL
tara:strand:- start:672 stop:2600 length:1929 start_codon:yes stop_codon:yes gene_type:complete